MRSRAIGLYRNQPGQYGFGGVKEALEGPSKPVYENIVESELEQKRLELLLHLEVGFLGLARGKDVMRRHGSAIHFRLFDLVLSGGGRRSRTGEGGLMVGD